MNRMFPARHACQWIALPGMLAAGLLVLSSGAGICPAACAAPAAEPSPPSVAAAPDASGPSADTEAAPKKEVQSRQATPPPPTLMKDPAAIPAASETDLRDKWGIEVLSLRRTAGECMIDFRYRVLDPEKAAPLFDGRIHPYVINEATGAKCVVPKPPKVGQLRTTRAPAADRIYFMIFANPGRQMQAGSKITVVAGDLKLEHLTLE